MKKHFILVSVFMIMLMVFLGGCEQPADSSGGSGGGSGGGNSSETAPDAPQNVEATAISSTNVTVTWDSVGDADEYEVYYGKSSSETNATRGGTTSGTSKSISGLTASTKYYVWVKSLNADGEKSDFSDVASVTTESSSGGGGEEEGAAPSAPRNVEAVETSSSTINITWDSVSDADEYTVYYRKRSNNENYEPVNLIRAGTTTRTSYSVQSLLANTTYFFWITASNSSGKSDYSVFAYATTEKETLSAPTGLSATSSSPGKIYLTWNRVSGATGYDIFGSTSSSSSSANKITSATGTSTTLNGGSGTTFYLWVKAKKGAITSDFSSRVSVTVQETPSGTVIFVNESNRRIDRVAFWKSIISLNGIYRDANIAAGSSGSVKVPAGTYNDGMTLYSSSNYKYGRRSSFSIVEGQTITIMIYDSHWERY